MVKRVENRNGPRQTNWTTVEPGAVLAAHRRAKHEHNIPYEETWPVLRDGRYIAARERPTRTLASLLVPVLAAALLASGCAAAQQGGQFCQAPSVARAEANRANAIALLGRADGRQSGIQISPAAAEYLRDCSFHLDPQAEYRKVGCRLGTGNMDDHTRCLNLLLGEGTR